jgi:hypothetical protein
MRICSIYDCTILHLLWEREYVIQLVTQTVPSSLENYTIPFSTYFHYSYAGVKFKYPYTGLFLRKVAYTRYDVAWFVRWMDFT